MFSNLFKIWRQAFLGIPRGVWMLSWVSLVNRTGSMVIIFISLYLTQKMGYSLEQAGVAMSFFGIGAIAGSYFGGWLTDKVGYLKIQFWSLALGGLSIIALLFVHQFEWMCLSIGLMSFITESFRPANSVAILRHSDPETRTRSFSLLRMSFNLGWTLAPVLGGFLIATWGWNSLFYFDGLTCIMAAILLVLTIREKKSVPTNYTDSDAPPTPATDRQPLHDTTFLFFWVLTLLASIVFMQLVWTVPLFFKEMYHWDEVFIGKMMALNGLIVAGLEMPLIFYLDGKQHPFFWVRRGLLMYLFSYLAFVMFPQNNIGALMGGLVYVLLISLGEIFVMPFSATWATLRAGKDTQGKYMAMYSICFSLAHILSPLMGTQMIARWGYASLWMLMVFMSVVAWWGFKRLDDRPTEAPLLSPAKEAGQNP